MREREVMAKILMGHEIGAPLIKALGLPGNCTSFELRCAVGEPVSVRCEYYPSGSAAEIVAALAEYQLVKREAAPQPVASMGFDAWMRERTETAHAALMARGAQCGIGYGRAA